MRHLQQTVNYLHLMAVVLLLCLAGCVSRPAESQAIRGITPTEAVAINDVVVDNSKTSPTTARNEVNILALSGGGTDGAYGVGVLNGWSQSGTRPQFDIVTGVSSGALISVFAFLGPQYDARLKELFLQPKSSDIFRSRGITGIFFDSFFDNTPLKRRIEENITPAILERVAAEHAKGRRLYVATTNLDAKELVVWDMGLLASGGGNGRSNALQLFQKVLRASAAIPIVFPPVYIKPKRGVQLRQAHVDGGLKAPVLLSDFIFQSPAKRRNLYVIINGSLALEETFEAVKPNLLDLAVKSTGTLTRELTLQTVYRGYVRSRNSGTEFFLTAIPEEFPPPKNALDFDPTYLHNIYESGFNEVQKPGFWWKAPPTLKRFDRLSRR